MPASAADIARVRRMVNEPTEDTYTDEVIADYIESWPLIDSNGRNYENSNWSEAYDINAAAADIWDEKASTVSSKHDFSADGATYSSNQMYENAIKQAKHFRAMQKASFKRAVTTHQRATYFPDYANPIYDEDEPTDFTDDILG